LCTKRDSQQRSWLHFAGRSANCFVGGSISTLCRNKTLQLRSWPFCSFGTGRAASCAASLARNKLPWIERIRLRSKLCGQLCGVLRSLEPVSATGRYDEKRQLFNSAGFMVKRLLSRMYSQLRNPRSCQLCGWLCSRLHSPRSSSHS
jgi:hypothetical protein